MPVVKAGALPCSVQLAWWFHVLQCAHPCRCVLPPGLWCTVHSAEQTVPVGLTTAYLLEPAQPRAPPQPLLLAGNRWLHQCWLPFLKLPRLAAGLQIDSLVDVQAKVLSVLHHDTAAISAVRCLKLFLERLGCAFGEGEEAEVSTA